VFDKGERAHMFVILMAINMLRRGLAVLLLTFPSIVARCKQAGGEFSTRYSEGRSNGYYPV